MSDLISREEVIKAVKFYETFCDPYPRVIEALEDLPSVQPRKGKWIEHDDGWTNVYYECSVCKEPFVLIDGTPTENLYNFCPNCGCRMEGGDSE